MTLKPRTGSSVLIYDDNKVLLIKRGKDPYKGYWSLPGGSQELGETLEEAARRELKEETNLEVTTMQFVKVRDRITKDENSIIKFHFVLATFAANKFSGIPEAKDDADDIGWFTLSQMKDVLTTPQTPNFIEEILSELAW